VDAAQFELTQVRSKDAAIAYLEKKQSNVILFALSLAEKNLEAVKQLDSLYPDVPIVVISNVLLEK
jgi:DNA-binding NarL/FixJ family response regulator